LFEILVEKKRKRDLDVNFFGQFPDTLNTQRTSTSTTTFPFVDSSDIFSFQSLHNQNPAGTFQIFDFL
jgi:hypothetical protein